MAAVNFLITNILQKTHSCLEMPIFTHLVFPHTLTTIKGDFI